MANINFQALVGCCGCALILFLVFKMVTSPWVWKVAAKTAFLALFNFSPKHLSETSYQKDCLVSLGVIAAKIRDKLRILSEDPSNDTADQDYNDYVAEYKIRCAFIAYFNSEFGSQIPGWSEFTSDFAAKWEKEPHRKTTAVSQPKGEYHMVLKYTWITLARGFLR